MKCLFLSILSFLLCFTSILGGVARSQQAVDGWSSDHSEITRDASGWVEEPVGYSGPIAVPKILADGSLADVPEVAAARAVHLAAVHAAASDPRAQDGDDGQYDINKYGDNRYPYHDLRVYNPAMAEGDLAAWKLENKPTISNYKPTISNYKPTISNYKPLPNPHAREAAERAWRV